MAAAPCPLTVVMAVHNGAPFLREAMDSILGQTYQAFRFLVVDDASTDDTRRILRSYDDARVERIELDRNVGQTAALNVGVRQAETPWIARMDADDYAAPTRFEAQMRALAQDGSLGCLGTFAWTFRQDPQVREGRLEKPVEDAAIKRQLLRGIPLIHGSIIISRAALLGVGGYDERYRSSADLDLYHRLFPACRVANLPEPLLGVRRHANQGSFTRVCAEENIEIFSRLLTAKRLQRERAVLRQGLSYSYLTRAKCWDAEGRPAERLKDLASAFRLSPPTMLKHVLLGDR